MPAISINTANVNCSTAASTFTGTAGETISAGQPVYRDGVTTLLNGVATYKRANAFVSNAVVGIAECGATLNQPFVICQSDPNFGLGGPVNTGNIVLLGNTPGAIQPYDDRATGWYVNFLGVGVGGNRINFSLSSANAAM